jgi:hypothetical protein
VNENTTISPPFQRKLLPAIFFFIGLSVIALSQTQDSASYKRVEAEAIRTHLQDILSQPQYQPQKTFKQWLFEKFSSWDMPDLKLSSQWVELLIWILIVWCVLALAAILIHFLWTLWVMLKSGSNTGPAKPDRGDSDADLSCEQLLAKAREQEMAGLYLSGIRYLIKSLIRRLDDMRIVQFHESKTNGDYLREYPKDNRTIRDFMEFISLFELAFYGRSLNARQAYQQMMNLYSAIWENNVQKQ